VYPQRDNEYYFGNYDSPSRLWAPPFLDTLSDPVDPEDIVVERSRYFITHVISYRTFIKGAATITCHDVTATEA